ncbi:MAG: hypothetical protein E4H14_06955 [Candidatus Thorarchaeota archaeon]|nr:MAG: hypothetical protein E4H14_06955 [Candidatus Thorarchaeota archaeon]
MKLKDVLTENPLRDIEDEMGTALSPQEKAHMARERNAKNKHRASEEIQQLIDEIYDDAVRAYSDVRVFRNYGVNSANVKVGDVRARDRMSPNVEALEARLAKEYGIGPRRSGASTILYHVPYDLFDQNGEPS